MPREDTVLNASDSTSPERTLAGQAAAAIQRSIIAGEYEPGRRLRIEELAELFDMSPMPIREALNRLDILGFVEQLPHRGARVTAMSVDDLLDTYSVRIPLELLAVRRAARNFRDEDAATAERWLAAYMAHDVGDWEAREANMEFHFTLYRAARSRWLVRSIRPLFENSERYRMSALAKAGGSRARRKRHQELLDACVAHDEDLAAERLREMLMVTVRSIEPKLHADTRFALETVELAAYLPVGDEPKAA
jgi:DNA-binding GntR family transcriptional regulator